MATTRTPYTDTNLHRRVVNEMISIMEWSSAPLIPLLGLENEKRFRFTDWPPGNSKKVEWLEDTLAPRQDAIDGAIDASQTTVLVDNGAYFQQGHVIQVDSEYMYVSSITGNTLTVSRAYGGTTQRQCRGVHADNRQENRRQLRHQLHHHHHQPVQLHPKRRNSGTGERRPKDDQRLRHYRRNGLPHCQENRRVNASWAEGESG